MTPRTSNLRQAIAYLSPADTLACKSHERKQPRSYLEIDSKQHDVDFGVIAARWFLISKSPAKLEMNEEAKCIPKPRVGGIRDLHAAARCKMLRVFFWQNSALH